jgi:hypothetical protein
MESIGSMDFIGLGALGIGALMFFIGWIWLVVVGFKQGGVTWGVLIFLLNWFAGIIFCLVKKTGWLALGVMTVGGILAGVGAFPLISKLLTSITG